MGDFNMNYKMFSESSCERNRNFVHFKGNDRMITKRIVSKPSKGTNESFVNTTDTSKKEADKCRDILNDYLECSSVHGVQYFGNLSIKIGTFGKLLWACVMIIGFVCSALMVKQFLQRYYDNPTNTYIKSFYSPIYLVPFPAVTLCPHTTPSLKKRLRIFKKLQVPSNLSNEEAMLLLKYGYKLSHPFVNERHKYLDAFKSLLKANNWKLVDFFNVTRSCRDIAESCWWNEKKISCTNFFRISYTAQGVCCSFNYLLEDYIEHGGVLQTLEPRYTDQYGPRSGLKLVLKQEILKNDNDTVELREPIINSIGVPVFIHGSKEYLGEKVQIRVLQANNELQLGIAPSLFRKPPNFYSRKEDGELTPLCIPNDERALKYYPKYEYLNCFADCRVEIMIELCGCIPYNYEPIRRYYNINSCELDGLTCIQNNWEYIRIAKSVQDKDFSCTCEPPCNSMVYDVMPTVVTMAMTNLSPSYYNITDGKAVLRVFMTSQIFQVLETMPAADEMYLLASIGGIFSLFLGCSFLSAVEIIHFGGLMLRAIFARRKQNTYSHKQRNTLK